MLAKRSTGPMKDFASSPSLHTWRRSSNASATERLWSRWWAPVEAPIDLVVRAIQDQAQETTSLTQQEKELRTNLKARILGLAAVQRICWRLWARITWLKLGHANTKYFHLKASSRKRKNYIHFLTKNYHTFTHHEEKEEALHTHFKELLRTVYLTTSSFDWNLLRLNSTQDHFLQDVEVPFIELEIKSTIK